MRRILPHLALGLIGLLLLGCAAVGPARDTEGVRGPTSVPQPADGWEARVTVVADGDSIRLSNGREVRYIGINAPEAGQPFADAAREANRQLVQGKAVWLALDAQATDRYGRLLAYVWVDDRFVNEELLRLGYSHAYIEPPNVRYSTQLLAAQQEAMSAQLGLWVPSGAHIQIREIHFDAPGVDDKNPNGEWIEIQNSGSEPADLVGFRLKDEANHIYVFPHALLQPGDALRLFSGRGSDGAGSLFWGLIDDAVWSNAGDTAFLWDAQSRLVDLYGYKP